MNKPQIYVDMDGVLVNFLDGALTWFGVDYDIETQWPKGRWGDNELIKEIFGLTEDQFWTELSDDYFWEHLMLMPDARALLTAIDQYKPVILTAPARSGGASGKQRWIERHLPEYFKEKRYIICPDKKYVAGPGRILIDDSEKNIKDWNDAGGGIGILYPRRWNQFFYIQNPLEFALNSIEYCIDIFRQFGETCVQ